MACEGPSYARRSKTLAMRKRGSEQWQYTLRRWWNDDEMEGRRIKRKNEAALLSNASVIQDEPTDLDAVIGAEEEAAVADDAGTARPMTIAEAVVAALRAHPTGLAQCEIPDAASAAAGVALNPVSASGQLQRMRTQGLIVREDGRWKAV